MKIKFVVITLALLMCSFLARAQPVTDQIIVKYKTGASANSLRAFSGIQSRVQALNQTTNPKLAKLRQTANKSVVYQISKPTARGSFHTQALNQTAVTQAELDQIIQQIAADPNVEYVEPDVILQPSLVPNDPRFNDQWHHYEPFGINLPDVWDITTGEGVVVAVVDTGFRPHVDLVENLLPGYDMISGRLRAGDGDGRDPDATDEGDSCFTGFSSFHGTHVAGTIAAVANNNQGVAGVAFNSKVLPIRALGRCGGFLSDIADGIFWAAGGSINGLPENDYPAQVINLSLGGNGSCSRTLVEAIEFARQSGAVVVAAAGNESEPADDYQPASCPGVITVAASTRDGTLAPYSNFGNLIDVTAPGGDSGRSQNGVLSTAVNVLNERDTYFYYTGTSMAAPHVSGLAALLLALDDYSPSQVEAMIIGTATPLENCDVCGAGLIDAVAAIAGGTQPNIAVTVAGSGRVSGGTTSYTATVENNGFDVANNVEFLNTLPSDTAMLSIESSFGSCDLSTRSCDFGDLNVGEIITVDITVSAKRLRKKTYDFTVSTDSEEFRAKDNKAEFTAGAFHHTLILLIVVVLARRIPFFKNKWDSIDGSTAG